MRKEFLKKSNKGFSLVELIIVIAIMAVLIGILAPQYLRYVEKTRLQKDNSAMAEIANGIKIAMSDETINTKTITGTTITIAGAVNNDKTITFTTTTGTVEEELSKVIGTSFKTTSNSYNKSDKPIVFTITKTDNGATVGAVGWIEKVGDTPSTTAKIF